MLAMKALLLLPSRLSLEKPTTCPKALMLLARLKGPLYFRIPKSIADPLLNIAAWLVSFLPKVESPTTWPELLIPNPRLILSAGFSPTFSIPALASV